MISAVGEPLSEPSATDRAPRLVRSATTLMRESLAEVLLLGPSGSEVTALSGAATALWEAFSQPRVPDEVLAELAAVFGISSAEIASDVGPIIDQLRRQGLLVATTPGEDSRGDPGEDQCSE